MTGPTEDSFTRTFFTAMMLRIGLAVVAMALAYGGAALGRSTDGSWAPFIGALTGLGLGVVLAALVLRRAAAASAGAR